MATAAEPRPAELPLSGGGAKGIRVKLHPLLTAKGFTPPAWFLREEGRLALRRAIGIGVPRSEWLPFPVPAFLIEHPSAGRILIDTGFHGSVAANPQANLGRLNARFFRDVEIEPDQAVAAQLRARGIQPADVKVVVMTHLHSDHASAIADFPDATFVVSATEWAAAADGGPIHGYVKRQFDHGFDWRLLDFEGTDAQSFSGFARSFDLFGDESVRTVYTPGHTLGHMSVVVNTARGEVLVAADAIYLHRTLADTHLPHRVADEHLFRRSLREIRQYATETPDALIVPGHDWDAWQALDATY
jgi:glyoxylase-like metal-dependent hydrolase (beta-lactamase superfamily II)